jgi:hypothetical protein
MEGKAAEPAPASQPGMPKAAPIAPLTGFELK